MKTLQTHVKSFIVIFSNNQIKLHQLNYILGSPLELTSDLINIEKIFWIKYFSVTIPCNFQRSISSCPDMALKEEVNNFFSIH